MQQIWDTISHYYFSLAQQYRVNPVIFISIHLIGTPLFITSIAWLIKNHQQKKSIGLPLFFSFLIYNLGNIYLVFFGQNISWFVYTLLAITTMVSGYFAYKKVFRQIIIKQ